MGVPWEHSKPIGVPSETHGSTTNYEPMGVLEEAQGSIMIPWKSHDGSIAIPWTFHGSQTAHGRPMGALLESRAGQH